MKTYLKTLTKMFKNHLTRFLSIIFMVLISVGFCSGIGSASDKISYSLSNYYKEANASDLILKSTSQSGFSAADVSALEDIYGAENVNALTAVDVSITLEEGGKKQLVRLYFIDFENWSVNVVPEFGILSGGMPEGEGYALSERSDKKISGVKTGKTVRIDFNEVLSDLGSPAELPLPPVELEICGEVQGPLSFGQDGEPSTKNGEDVEIPETTNGINDLICLDNILYVSGKVIPELPYFGRLLPVTDIHVSFPDKDRFKDFSAGYREYVDGEIAKVKALLLSGEEGAVFADGVKILTLYDNYSFNALHSYCEKVTLIGYILMLAFLFVTALVVLSTMTRLLEEERSQVACLRTLGYSSFRIIFKYLLFAAVATGIGGVGAYFIGMGLANLIYNVFNYSFAMPHVSGHVAMLFFAITFAVIVAATLFATFICGRKLTSETPADLLRPKPPRAGKKVIIEKIPFIWNRLSFKYKSTTRNVLRYKSRFIMTVVAVAISMALVMAGLALLDICLFRGVNSTSIIMIATVIVVFAGLLTAVVIYTLTNINISERNRELATLMVLGYQNGEVAGYIYREIYIDTAVGIIFGYPLSALIMMFLFSIMNAGTYATVMWAVAPFVILLFTAAVTLILRRKITRIDMNESLKAIE